MFSPFIRTVIFLSMTLSSTSFADLINSNENGLISLCKNNEICATLEPTLIAYGQDGHYSYKVLDGTFYCNENTFNGEPSDNNNNACFIYPDSNLDFPSKPVSAETAEVTPQTQNEKPKFIEKFKPGKYLIVSKHTGKALEIKDSLLDDGAKIEQADITGKTNQIWLISDLENGYFSIRSALSQKSLDIFEWSVEDGAMIQQHEWLDSWNQHWTIQHVGPTDFSILSRFSGKSIDVYHLSHGDENKVHLWTYWGGENQQWGLVEIRDK